MTVREVEHEDLAEVLSEDCLCLVVVEMDQKQRSGLLTTGERTRKYLTCRTLEDFLFNLGETG